MRASRGMGDIRASKKPKFSGGGKAKLSPKGWIGNAANIPGAMKTPMGIRKDKPVPTVTLGKQAKAFNKPAGLSRVTQTVKRGKR